MCRCRRLWSLAFAVMAWLATAQAGTVSERDQAMEAKPLNHTVRVHRMGRVLKLDYALVGADGREYSLWELVEGARPTFAICQDGVQVAGGTFEHG